MSKNKKQEIIEVELVEEQPVEEVKPFEYKNKAYGIYRVVEGTDVRYKLVEIGYDPESGDVSPIKELAKDIREDIIDKFKAAAGELFAQTTN